MSIPYVEFPSDDTSLLTCCQRACPIGTDVSAYIALVAEGRFGEALAIVREENPFPGTCGRVCDHACEVHCRRAESDQPVAIRALKRFLADRERAGQVQWPERILPWRPQKVAVIGAGPAGLTAASDLLRRGFSVTVFEALPMAGGMMRVGIPDYRLPPDVLEFDLEHLRKLGIEIRPDTALGRDFTLGDLRHRGYKAVLLATGAHASRRLNVKGAELSGLMFGIDLLRQVNLGGTPKLGRRVTVIGGGDVAMDTARVALRLGAERVQIFCLESREEMPAHDWETREALDEHVQFNCGWGPSEFIGNDQVHKVRFVACTSVFDSSGKFAPTFDHSETATIEADSVLLAIGQVAQFAHAPEDAVEVTPGQLYRVDPSTLKTTAPWIFAAGDAVYGTDTVIKAVTSGHRAATSICEYLEDRPLTGRWEPMRHERRVERIQIPQDWEEKAAAQEPELLPQERVQSFSEVKLGLAEAVAVAEAARCMRCDYETNSYTYSRAVREQIYHLSRDIGNDETACLGFLQRRLSESRSRPRVKERAPSFDDLVFLPANLTRLVIDPYREQCNTRTVIGARAVRPLELAGPIVIGGLPLSEPSGRVLAALCRGTRGAGIGLRVPIGVKLPTEDLHLMRVAPLRGRPESIGDASALELAPEDASAALDRDVLRAAADAYRALVPDVPIGVGISPGQVASNVQAAVEGGLDFVTLFAVGPSDGPGSASWVETSGLPQIDVLADAVEGLRAINREEDIDLVYFGCIRGGGDAAKALALGAGAVMIGQAALIAAGAVQDESEVDQAAECILRFVRAMLMEASILARGCGKTDVHNLEPEDLRSLTIETSRSTGIPLVGRDVIFRNTGS